jgi:hypothetical protein
LYAILCIAEYILGGKSCQEAYVGEQLLSEAQEEILVIRIQGHHGIAMTYSSVVQCVNAILGKQVGELWPKQFHKHHPNLKMKNMRKH